MLWDESSLGCDFNEEPVSVDLILLKNDSKTFLNLVFTSSVAPQKQKLRVHCSELGKTCEGVKNGYGVIYQATMNSGFVNQVVVTHIKSGMKKWVVVGLVMVGVAAVASTKQMLEVRKRIQRLKKKGK
ncbi:Hypothetical_protein [Hexamita inflata]|uniref:Hypothetical_protein n=1 Tax=Hexamita inflata TaxID=28002 RepID=A0AA86R3R4_9EUKA|nr:Hypothetical protein HINF_LOCUS53168 [Hexamita inflata]